jgi:predicted membrane protein
MKKAVLYLLILLLGTGLLSLLCMPLMVMLTGERGYFIWGVPLAFVLAVTAVVLFNQKDKKKR